MNLFRNVIVLKSIFIVAIVSSCTKDAFQSSIPNTPVYWAVNSSQQNQLMSPGAYLINPSQGYAGVILLHGGDGEFYAFDLSCPYESSPSISVVANDSVIVSSAQCPECQSKYELFYGSAQPSLGPSNESLKKYSVTQSGDWIYVAN